MLYGRHKLLNFIGYCKKLKDISNGGTTRKRRNVWSSDDSFETEP
jgi:hypothetical protein